METEKETKAAVKMTDESMTEKHRSVLRKVRESLVKDMDPKNVLLKMARSNVFTEDQEATIKGKGLRHEQCEELLDTLQRRGDRAYDIFKKALEKDHPHLANEILKAEYDELNLELIRERTNSARLQKRALGNQTCSRCHDLGKELNALKKELETLEKEKNDRETKIKESDMRNKHLEQKVENLRKEKHEIESEKNKHKREKESLQKEKGDIETKIKNLDHYLKEQIEVHNKEKSEIEFQRNQIQQELKKSEKSLEAEQKKNVQVIKEKDKLKQENIQYQNKLKHLTNKLEKLENAEPDSASSRSSSENDGLLRQPDDKQSKCNGLERNIRNYKSSLSKNQTPQQDLDDKRESKRKKVDKPKPKGDKERKTLEKEIKDKDAKITELEEANAKLKAYEPIIDDLKKQLESQRRERKEEREEAARREKSLKEAVFHSRVFVPSQKKGFFSYGVLHYLNRVSSAKLVATRSSDGPGNARDILDRKKYATSGTEEKTNSWWCVDLGEDHLLAITHYALRHGNIEGESVLLKWKIEGSTDGKHFLEIKTNEKIDNPPRYREGQAPGRWSVDCKVGVFRYIRIFQTGRNSSNNYGIYLSGVELYGVLFKV